MKDFLKCKICGEHFVYHHLGHHIRKSHKMSAESYYLQYIGKVKKCKNKKCKNNTKFKGIDKGFMEYCSPKCSNSDPIKKKLVEKICLNKYGFKNVFQVGKIKKDIEEKIFKKYGVSNPSSSPIIKQKKIATSIKNYGSIEAYNTAMKNARSKTNLERYGVENYLQTWDGQYKSIKSSYKKKPFTLPSGKIVYKQGYEPNFMDYVFNNKLLKEKEIDYYPSGIKYIDINGKKRYYFPDFHIIKHNLIVECKSTWTMQTDKNIKNKENAVRKMGYNYILIINNNFNRFCAFLKNDKHQKI